MEIRKRVLIITGEFFYAWIISESIRLTRLTIDKDEIEIINDNINVPDTIKSVELALALIKEHKPDIVLLDHFLSGNPMSRILEKIKPEDGEGIEIAEGINFFYVREIRPEVISISSRSKEEIKLLYGDRIKHCMEGDIFKLAQCLKGKCLC